MSVDSWHTILPTHIGAAAESGPITVLNIGCVPISPMYISQGLSRSYLATTRSYRAHNSVTTRSHLACIFAHSSLFSRSQVPLCAHLAQVRRISRSYHAAARYNSAVTSLVSPSYLAHTSPISCDSEVPSCSYLVLTRFRTRRSSGSTSRCLMNCNSRSSKKVRCCGLVRDSQP